MFGISSYNKPNFISWLLDKFNADKTFNVIEGQYATPTITDDIAQAVLQVLIKTRYGIYNAAGTTFLNRYELAVKTAKCFGFNPELVQPIKPSELIQKAKRPEKAGLVTLKAISDLQCDFADVESALFSYRLQINEEQQFYSNFLYN